MFRFLLCLTLIWFAPSALSAQSLPDQLSPSELRLLLSQLYELQAARERIAAYEAYVAREQAQDERERENAARAMELEKQAVTLAQKERDLALEKAAMYEQLWKAATAKKCGVGGSILRVLSLWTYRCGG